MLGAGCWVLITEAKRSAGVPPMGLRESDPRHLGRYSRICSYLGVRVSISQD